MSALPQEPIEDSRTIKKLLENHSVREAFEILAARIILANGQTRETIAWPRLPNKIRKIALLEKDLEEIRTGRYGRIQLPSEEQARYWLKQWREGPQRRQEVKE